MKRGWVIGLALLAPPGCAGLFDVDDPSLIGRAENPATFPLEYVFDVGGQTLVIAGEPRVTMTATGQPGPRPMGITSPTARCWNSGRMRLALGRSR